MTDLKLDPRVAQYAVQAGCRVLATFAVLQGIAIILTDSARWGGPSFATAMTLPGAPPSWGFVLFALGLLALVGSLLGRFAPVIIGLWGSSVWCMFFALSFAQTFASDKTASSTGIFAYGALCLMFVGLAKIYSISRKLHYADRSRNSRQ